MNPGLLESAPRLGSVAEPPSAPTATLALEIQGTEIGNGTFRKRTGAAQWLLTCAELSRKVYTRREERPRAEEEEACALCGVSQRQPNGAF